MLGVVVLHTPHAARPPLSSMVVGLAGLGAAVISQLALRRAALKYTAPMLVTCLSLGIVILAPFLPGESWILPPSQSLPAVAAIIVTSIIAQLCVTASFRYLEAPTASVLGLLSLVWGVGLEEVLDHHDVTIVEYAAYGLILCGVGWLQVAAWSPPPSRPPPSLSG